MTDIPQNVRLLVIHQHQQGLNQVQIAAYLNLTRWTVGRIIRRHQASGAASVNRTGRCGRRRSLTLPTERRLARTSTINPRLTSRQLQHAVGGEAVEVNTSTIRRSLLRSGVVAYRPRPAPGLTAARKQVRHTWARQHLDWTADDWHNVVFSDETSIEVGAARSHYVRRGRGLRVTEAHTVQRRNFQVKVMFWGCITGTGPGDLVPVQRNMNADRYVAIIEDHVVPATDGGNRIYQQDNAPAHKSRRAINCLEQHGVEVLPWPPYSPDMNIIENVWAQLKEKVHQRSYYTRQELIEAAQQIWHEDEDIARMIRNCYESMPNRVLALSRARGGYTGY